MLVFVRWYMMLCGIGFATFWWLTIYPGLEPSCNWPCFHCGHGCYDWQRKALPQTCAADAGRQPPEKLQAGDSWDLSNYLVPTYKSLDKDLSKQFICIDQLNNLPGDQSEDAQLVWYKQNIIHYECSIQNLAAEYLIWPYDPFRGGRCQSLTGGTI